MSNGARFSGCVAGVLAAALLAPALGRAGVGDVDPAYGDRGIFRFTLSAAGDCLLRSFSAPVAQAGLLGDGSVVYSTSSGSGTTQYGHTDVDGRPDPAYGSGGSRALRAGFEMCSAGGQTGPALRMADGKLWLGGSLTGSAGRQSAILRLDASGNPDTSFGAGGMVTRPAGSFEVNSKSGDGNWVYRFAQQSDGRVLALFAGFSSPGDIAVGIRRYNTDGSDDAGFGTSGGAAVLPIHSLPYFYVQPGGGIYLGWDYGDIELNLDANGADVNAAAAINAGAFPANAYWWRVAALPGGDSLFAGSDETRVLVARLHADGTPARSFGGSGTGYLPIVADRSGVTLTITSVASATASSDGRFIFVAGTGRSGTGGNFVNAVARLDGATGALDPLFGDRGIVVLGRSMGVNDMVVQPDGSVVLLSGGRAIRLQASAAPSAGIIGVEAASAAKTAGTMTVRVSRTAGNAGAVSAAYATNDTTAALYPGGTCCLSATAGKDYTAVSGRLDWADGDTADKLITIPVMSDAGSSSSKVFDITFSNVTGSAVIAAPTVTATITSVATPATNSNAAVGTGVATTQPAGGGGSLGPWSAGLLSLCWLLLIASRLRPSGIGKTTCVDRGALE